MQPSGPATTSRSCRGWCCGAGAVSAAPGSLCGIHSSRRGCGALFGATAAVIGGSWVLPAYLWFAGLTLVLLVIDLDVKRIPNRVLYPGTIGALVLLAAGAAVDGTRGSTAEGRGGRSGATSAGCWWWHSSPAAGSGWATSSWASCSASSPPSDPGRVWWWRCFGAFVLGGVVAITLVLAGRARRTRPDPLRPGVGGGGVGGHRRRGCHRLLVSRAGSGWPGRVTAVSARSHTLRVGPWPRALPCVAFTQA